MTTPAELKLLHVISPAWALRKMRDKPRVELTRASESACWIRPEGDDRPTFSIGTTLAEPHRLRPEFGHLALAELTFKRLRDKLEPRKASSSDKLKLSRASLSNLADFPADSAGLDASHRCGDARCFAPGHIAWEDHALNTNRDACIRNMRVVCTHSPSCIRQPIISRVAIKGTSTRPGRRRKGVPPPSAYGGDTPGPEIPPPAPTKSSTNANPAALPTPPLTPPPILENQLPSLAGPSRPAASRPPSSSSSSSRRSPSSSSSSPSSRTSRASSELSVVPDSEDEDAWEAFEDQEVEVEKAEVELEERLFNKRRRSVKVLDLTGSDDKDVEVVRVKGGGNEAGALVSSSKGQVRDEVEQREQRRKRLFDLVSAELATLERPQKRQRPAIPVHSRLIARVGWALRNSRIEQLFRAHRPLASWMQAFKSCWKWIE